MPSLLTPISALPGARSDIVKKFHTLGLHSLQDALFYFPFRHEDWRQRTTIDRVQPGQQVTLLVTVLRLSGRRGWRRRVSIVEARVTDRSKKSFYVVWYNQPYLTKTIKVNDQLFISGLVVIKNGKRLMQNPIWERPSADPLHDKLVPVYRTIEGLSQRQLRKVIKTAVALADLVPDVLPTDVTRAYHFLPMAEALASIHFPTSPEQAAEAVRRLKFDELLAWQLAWQRDQQAYQDRPARSFPFQEAAVRAFVQSLPFGLTPDQRLAAWQILQDLAKAQPMSRLLQGDVGSGKTVVAAIVADNVVKQSGQVAFLTPTVLLAEQHYRTFAQLFAGHQVVVALVTGNQAVTTDGVEPPSRAAVAADIRSGKINIVVGTHALIDSTVAFADLGLVIVDEQQRFGVEQRDALLTAAKQRQPTVPHFLSLTATPIPRTLALFVAGELAITTLRHKPAGRGRVATEVIESHRRRQITAALTATAAAGRQAYIITPLIAESDALGVRAATTEYERWQEQLPRLRIGLVHGAMPAVERLAVLDRFRRQRLDVLVGTTVLEVGLDVPNATLMVIEGAERFGLTQLHQLRGRVGRGETPGRCLLATDQDAPAIINRLRQVATIDDGFRLSELDLAERGGGELYGLRQSGLPAWQLATLADGELLTIARTVAQELLTRQDHRTIQALTDNVKLPGVSHRE